MSKTIDIEPFYVTFEQAKHLKEKGFDMLLKTAYAFDGLEANVPNGEFTNKGTKYILRPEQWQVIEWLRTIHNIDLCLQVEVTFHENVRKYYISIFMKGDYIGELKYPNSFEFDTPQEAYSAAFDFIFNHIILENNE